MFRLFKKLIYTIISKTTERKINKKYGCDISIKITEYKVRGSDDGKVRTKIKTEIISYEKDCKKLINALLKENR